MNLCFQDNIEEEEEELVVSVCNILLAHVRKCRMREPQTARDVSKFRQYELLLNQYLQRSAIFCKDL